MSYLELIRTHGRFLGFAFTLTFFSAFGQTFFISLFNEPIRAEFNLSHGGFGGLYSLATLASGFTIIWLGQKIDTVDLRIFALTLCIGFEIAAVIMGCSVHIGMLIVAIYLLRLIGQGLFGHTAATSMARYFDAARGKALSISSLGYAAGEAVMPPIAVFAIATFGWRWTWTGIAAVLMLIVAPLILILLRDHGTRHEAHLRAIEDETEVEDAAAALPIVMHDARDDHDEQIAPSPAAHTTAPPPGHHHHQRPAKVRSWSRREVLRDPRFYLIIPAVTAPGFIVTGLFFHQAHLVETKGWTMAFFALCFMIFAAPQIPAGLIAGPLVDRFTAKRLMSVFLLPLLAACLVLGSSSHAAIAVIFMFLAGISAGVTGTIIGSMWAEVYGVKHLGAIRAMATAVMVFATAGSPVSMGWLIDAGVTMEAISLACAGWCATAMALAWVAMRK